MRLARPYQDLQPYKPTLLSIKALRIQWYQRIWLWLNSWTVGFLGSEQLNCCVFHSIPSWKELSVWTAAHSWSSTMSTIGEDELMKDVEGEIPVPANLGDPAPEFFLSIWDDPHIIKIEFVGGKKGFY